MRSSVVFSGSYDGQIGFRVLKGDEIFRLERVRVKNGGGWACELGREMVEVEASIHWGWREREREIENFFSPLVEFWLLLYLFCVVIDLQDFKLYHLMN